MLRALVVVAVLHGTASADFGEQLEGELGAPDFEVTFVTGPPPGLETALDAAAAEERSAMFDRAIERTPHPLARANLRLARADLWAARAVRERIAALDDLEAHHDVAAARAIGRALADYHVLAGAAFAGWRPLDGALARYAYALGLAKLPDAVRVYRRLVADFPASPHAPHAHVVLGDLDLVAKRTPDALAHYTAAARPDAPAKLRAYAMYKLGWLEIEERGQAERAFARFAQALALEPDGPLAWELRRGITKAFALFGKPAEAFATFERLAPTRAFEMANDLAERLRANHRNADAITVLGELVRRAPDDVRACAWQREAAHGALAVADDVRFFTEVQRLAHLFERMRHQAIDRDVIADCEAAVVRYTLEVGRTHADKALQRQLYDLFLHAFPDRAALVK